MDKPVASVAPERDGPSAKEIGPIDKQVCEAFRLIRLASGLKRRDVAAALGVSHQTVFKWEHGLIRLFLDTLIQAASLFGVPVSDFFPNSAAASKAHRKRARLRRMKLAVTFMSEVRGIRSEALQETIALVTRLILDGGKKG